MDDELIKNVDVQRIAEEGKRVYDRVKVSYEPKENGKFLAIEVDSQDAFLGNSSAEALELAKQKYPGKVFYVVRIGFDVAETLAMSFSK